MFFGDREREKDRDGEELISPKLSAAFTKLRKQFDSPDSDYTVTGLSVSVVDSNTFFGFTHRIVAVESLHFLHANLHSIQKYIKVQ